MLTCFTTTTTSSTPIIFLTPETYNPWLEKQPAFTKNWLASQQFSAKAEKYCVIPNNEGKMAQVVIIGADKNDHFVVGALPNALPEGVYHLETYDEQQTIAWGMGSYQFTRYKKPSKKFGQLVLPEKTNQKFIKAMLNAIYLVRDLINTPPDDMSPEHLSAQAHELAEHFPTTAHCEEIVGDELLEKNYPAIHAVGRACHKAPRLIDLQWGNPKHPKVTLAGKGVCFDSGGLDIKTAAGMLTMKKDMGGAAHVLGLAYLIMSMELPVRLRVLIPAVENSISGNAYHPSDIVVTRKGLSVEIGNTDAEGRMVLSDALHEAASENPELLIDFATLTGAGRIALGTDLPALFSNNEALANALLKSGETHQDLMWRLPLHKPYKKLIESPIADLNNTSKSPYGGCITAALFLKEFVPDNIAWAHFDLMAANDATRPAHPEGGEAQAMRAVFHYLQERFK